MTPAQLDEFCARLAARGAAAREVTEFRVLLEAGNDQARCAAALWRQAWAVYRSWVPVKTRKGR